MTTLQRAGLLRCTLGEGPRWNQTRGTAQWVDIDNGLLYDTSVDSWDPRPLIEVDGLLPAALETSAEGQMLLVLRDGLAHVDAEGRVLSSRRLLEPGIDSRLNDASIDPEGRLLVGSLALDDRNGQERLWRLEHDGELTVLDDDLTISNGLGWSPDSATFYSVDSAPGKVWQRSYDPDSGRVGRRHLLTAIQDGHPDGLSVDQDGNVWIAIWGQGQVRCFDAGGQLIETLDASAPLLTSCAFVGPGSQTLLVTSANKTFGGIARTDDSGAVFTAATTRVGRMSTTWRPQPLGQHPTLPTVRSLS